MPACVDEWNPIAGIAARADADDVEVGDADAAGVFNQDAGADAGLNRRPAVAEAADADGLLSGAGIVRIKNGEVAVERLAAFEEQSVAGVELQPVGLGDRTVGLIGEARSGGVIAAQGLK